MNSNITNAISNFGSKIPSKSQRTMKQETVS